MTVKRVGIVGSGIMGAGIAEVAAKAGFDVVIRSRSAPGASETHDRNWAGSACSKDICNHLEPRLFRPMILLECRDCVLFTERGADHVEALNKQSMVSG